MHHPVLFFKKQTRSQLRGNNKLDLNCGVGTSVEDKIGVETATKDKIGTGTAMEDKILSEYINTHGLGPWNSLPIKYLS